MVTRICTIALFNHKPNLIVTRVNGKKKNWSGPLFKWPRFFCSINKTYGFENSILLREITWKTNQQTKENRQKRPVLKPWLGEPDLCPGWSWFNQSLMHDDTTRPDDPTFPYRNKGSIWKTLLTAINSYIQVLSRTLWSKSIILDPLFSPSFSRCSKFSFSFCCHESYTVQEFLSHSDSLEEVF